MRPKKLPARTPEPTDYRIASGEQGLLVITALVFAGGSGQRLNPAGTPKQFLELYGKPVIIHTLEIFQAHPEIDQIIVPCITAWEEHLAKLARRYEISKLIAIVPGGRDTQESKINALTTLAPGADDDDIVILHDAVRPLVTEELISANIACVREHGNAISYKPFVETGIVSNDGQTISATIERSSMLVAAAPQSFRFRDVYEAHTAGALLPPEVRIDSCSLMHALGHKLHLVPSDSTNIKLTTAEDFFHIKAILEYRQSKTVLGFA